MKQWHRILHSQEQLRLQMQESNQLLMSVDQEAGFKSELSDIFRRGSVRRTGHVSVDLSSRCSCQTKDESKMNADGLRIQTGAKWSSLPGSADVPGWSRATPIDAECITPFELFPGRSSIKTHKEPCEVFLSLEERSRVPSQAKETDWWGTCTYLSFAPAPTKMIGWPWLASVLL